MIKSILIKAVFGIALLFSVTTTIISCDKARPEHANYLPHNSTMVVSLNTQAIFTSAFMDLMSNMDLFEGEAQTTIGKLLGNPGSAGIDELNSHYLFLSGNDMFNARLGAVIPLSDADKLKSFVANEFGKEITEENGFSTVSLKSEVFLTFDENTAIFYLSGFGGDLKGESAALFAQTSEGSLLQTEPSFASAADRGAHITTWVKQADFSKFMAFGVQQFGGIGNFLKTDGVEGAYTVVLTNLNDGKIEVQTEQYLNDKLLAQEQSVLKENSIQGLLNSVTSFNPSMIMTTSLKSEGILEILKDYGVERELAELTGGAMNIQQILPLFSGDIMMSLEDFALVKKTVVMPVFDENTGEYNTDSVEVEEMMPNMVIGLGLADEAKFNEQFGAVLSSIPEVDGVRSYQGTHLVVKNGQLLLALTDQTKKIIVAQNGALSKELEALTTSNPVAVHLDLSRLLGSIDKMGMGEEAGKFAEIVGKYLKDATLTDGNLDAAKKISTSSLTINLTTNENALVAIMKMLNDLKAEANSMELPL